MKTTNLSVFRIALFILFILLLFSVVYVFLVLRKPEVKTNVTVENSHQNGSQKVGKSPYFTPPSTGTVTSTMSGQINPVYDVVSNSTISHELVDKHGTKIAYLYSVKHDLNLSVGFDVEISGDIDPEKYDGIVVVNVKSIKLK